MSKDTSVSGTLAAKPILSSQDRRCLYVAWTLTALSSALALYVWGHMSGWHFSFEPYQLFPLLGLLAFSIMWAHYVATFIRKMLHVKPPVLSYYFRSTSKVVLALLFLHPGIIIYQRFRDGYGLPPGSYMSYVAPGLGWVTLLGTVAWVAFIAFEFRHKYGKKSWWKYIPMAGDVAMLAIVYHGLRIGDHLQTGFYRSVWIGYGASLVLVLGYNYYRKYAKVTPAKAI